MKIRVLVIASIAFSSALAAFCRAGHSQTARLTITEFAADEQRAILDEDGDTSDWIEILNNTGAAVSLKGYYLTDNPQNLPKWEFPEVTLNHGQFLLVFASEKNRARAGSELHTNFRLEDDGEFLALIAPDGQTAVSSFSPQFPPQVPGASYGIAMEAKAGTLLPSGADARVLVPLDGALGLSWIEKDFDDSAWIAGKTGVGFDRKSTPTHGAVIQTDIQAQMDRVNSSAYIRIRFNVDDLSTADSVLLRMKYDDGFVAFLNGVEVASRFPPPALTWDARAINRRTDPESLVFEDILLSAGAAALRVGENILAIQGLNLTRADQDFLILPEVQGVDLVSINPDVEGYFPAPTPGRPNSADTMVPGVAEPPAFSHEAGAYPDVFNLAISVTSPTAVVRYTVDRREPTESSPVYSGPIPINGSTMVRAKVFDPPFLPSRTYSRYFSVLDSTTSTFSSNLPVMVFDTFGRAPDDINWTHVGLMIHEPGEDGRTRFTDPAAHVGHGGIHKRGSSSIGFPKNNYNLETWGEDLDDSEARLLGFPEESDWILHGPYSDKSLMRNGLSYEWSNLIGRYAPRTKYVELFIKTSAGGRLNYSSYYGVYVFMEKIKRDDSRVDIAKVHLSQNSEPEISGGYILKKDRIDPDETAVATARGVSLVFVEPKEPASISAQQRVWLKGYLDQFETALFGNNFRDPVEGYAKYIDVDSFIDHHILVELTKNIDGFRLSTFMYKDRGEKLNMGPIWDYNLSLGNANYLNGWLPEGWYYPQLSDGDYPWWRRIFQDPDFVRRYSTRWLSLREKEFTVQNVLASIDRHAETIREAQARNFRRWTILGTYIWPNQFIARTWDEEVNWMKNWTRDRLLWMDTQLVPPPAFSHEGGQIDPGLALAISSPVGKIYYTVNGDDPRTATGAIAPTAIEYKQPVIIDANTRVRARVQIGQGSWSSLAEGIFVVATPPLAVTEVMYTPLPATDGAPFSLDDFEFIEVQNVGAEEMDLTNVRFFRGVVFDFTGSAVTRLAPGEYAVVVNNLEAFKSRYGEQGIQIAGEFIGSLNSRGEVIAMTGPIGEPVLEFRYDSTWYPETAGEGHSLVLANPEGPRESWSEPASWRASRLIGGSPGAAEPPPGGLQRPGDASQDGSLSITDAIGILRHLFLGANVAGTPPCGGATIADGGNKVLLDLDGSSSVEITDAVYLLEYLFLDGPPPAAGAACIEILGCPEACAAAP